VSFAVGLNPLPGQEEHGADAGAEQDNEPRNILEEIVWYKNVEIEYMRNHQDLATLKRKLAVVPPARDFIGAIKAKLAATGRPGLIAEVKKASPSKGVIQPDFDPVKIAYAYQDGGAACLSVLTDEKYFQGSFENLQLIRQAGVDCPLLCKEFIIEAYQIFKARASGADAILLIAAVLPNTDLKYLMKCAHSLGLQCLIEVHDEAELRRVLSLEEVQDGAKTIVGINNRDLGTFKVDLNLTKRLMDTEPGRRMQEAGILCVGESGIFTYEDVKFVQDAGCDAILVGESIVKQGDPEAGVKALLDL